LRNIFCCAILFLWCSNIFVHHFVMHQMMIIRELNHRCPLVDHSNIPDFSCLGDPRKIHKVQNGGFSRFAQKVIIYNNMVTIVITSENRPKWRLRILLGSPRHEKSGWAEGLSKEIGCPLDQDGTFGTIGISKTKSGR